MHPRSLILLIGLAVLPVRVAGGEAASAGSVPCGPTGVDATVSLQYEDRLLGPVTGVFLLLAYPDGLTIPGTATDASVRERVTNLTGESARLVPTDDDGARRLRVLVTAPGEHGIRAREVMRVRFDCAAGAAVDPAALRCTTDQVADAAGHLMRPELARDVTCSVTSLTPAK